MSQRRLLVNEVLICFFLVLNSRLSLFLGFFLFPILCSDSGSHVPLEWLPSMFFLGRLLGHNLGVEVILGDQRMPVGQKQVLYEQE